MESVPLCCPTRLTHSRVQLKHSLSHTFVTLANNSAYWQAVPMLPHVKSTASFREYRKPLFDGVHSLRTKHRDPTKSAVASIDTNDSFLF